MVFSSGFFFFVFLPMTLIGYYLIKKDLRNLFLLVVSMVFYAWAEVKAVPILIALILFSYIEALVIERVKTHNGKRLLLLLGIIINVLVLGYFKYTNLIIETINQITHLELLPKTILLPVGISFFCFQSISYIADVSNGKTEAQRNIINVALYFAFFPKQTQGPIMRYSEFAGDIQERKMDVLVFSKGIQQFTIGLAKKLLIADQLGKVADSIFGIGLQGLNLPLAWGGILAYTLQIYFDFSGYSDMAIGLGCLFGFDLPENFDHPYIATSIKEFWRRWHISLSRWFRDYVYIPLGGNRKGNRYLNILIVFFLTGLWHGASWTFVIWGLFHGVIRIAEEFLAKLKIMKHIPIWVNYTATMFLVMIGWVLFRSPDLHSAVGYIGTMLGMRCGNEVQYRISWFYNNKTILITIIGIAAMLPWRQWIPALTAMDNDGRGTLLKTAATFFLLVICLALIMTSTYSSFIYFKF